MKLEELFKQQFQKDPKLEKLFYKDWFKLKMKCIFYQKRFDKKELKKVLKLFFKGWWFKNDNERIL